MMTSRRETLHIRRSLSREDPESLADFVSLEFKSYQRFEGSSCQLAVWSSGMILASGARDPGFNSQNSPNYLSCILLCIGSPVVAFSPSM